MMRILVYASLKEYFDSSFNLGEHPKDISELKEELIQINPAAANTLNLARFAVDDTFINTDYQFDGTEIISIIPPSSGG